MRLLHIDDNESDLAMVKEILVGHEVVSSTSLEEAFEIIRQGPLFDVLLLDLHMPGYTGAEAILHWRQEGCDRIPVVVLSGIASARTIASSCMSSGAPGNVFADKNKLTKDNYLLGRIQEAIAHQAERMKRGVSGIFPILDLAVGGG